MLRRALILLSASALALPAAALEIEGVRFDPVQRVRGVPFELHGAGLLRYRWVVKAYVAALYLGEGHAVEDVLGEAPRRLEIEYFWPIGAPDFARATLDGIGRNRGAAALAALRERIDRINRAYRDVRPGDRYSLTYLPGVGTELALDGEPLCLVEGGDFASALFSIWLGQAPLDPELKAQLLGAR